MLGMKFHDNWERLSVWNPFRGRGGKVDGTVNSYTLKINKDITFIITTLLIHTTVLVKQVHRDKCTKLPLRTGIIIILLSPIVVRGLVPRPLTIQCSMQKHRWKAGKIEWPWGWDYGKPRLYREVYKDIPENEDTSSFDNFSGSMYCSSQKSVQNIITQGSSYNPSSLSCPAGIYYKNWQGYTCSSIDKRKK